MMIGTDLLMSHVIDLDLGNSLSTEETQDHIMRLAHALHAKSCSEAAGSDKALVCVGKWQLVTRSRVMSHQGMSYKAEVEMTLEQKQVLLDVDERTLRVEQADTYPKLLLDECHMILLAQASYL